jgi:outer membrane protein assembly factor BamB
VVAYDAKTGQERWAVTAEWGDLITCALGSPLPLDLDGTAAVYVALGMVIRVADGKVLARGIGHEHDANNAVVCQGNIIVGVNGSGDQAWNPEKAPSAKGRVAVAHGTGMWAVRVSKDGADAAKAEQLWVMGSGGRQDGLAYADGILYARADCDKIRPEIRHNHRGGILAIEPATGKVLGHQPKMGTGFWKPVVAGGWYFNGDPKKGRIDIHTADAQLKPVGGGFLLGKHQNQDDPKFDEYWGRFYRTLAFVPSGNRIFVRGWDQLYCLGDPRQKMRLSKAQQ